MATKEDRDAIEQMLRTAIASLSPSQLADCMRSDVVLDSIRARINRHLEKAERAGNTEYLDRVAQDLRRIIAKGSPEELTTVGFTFTLGVLASRLILSRLAMDPTTALQNGLLLACVDMPTTEEEAADAGASVH